MKHRLRNVKETQGVLLDAELYRLNFWKPPENISLPLYPYAEEEVIRRNKFAFREQYSRYLGVCLLLEGELLRRSGKKEFVQKAGEISIIPPGASYGFEARKPYAYHKMVLEFKGLNLLSLLETLGLDQVCLLYPGERTEWVRELFIDISNMVQRNDHAETSELMGKCYSLLHELSTYISTDVPTQRLQAVAQARLENRLEEPLRISDLAAELHVSSTTLERLFLRKFGMTPQEYRIWCRMEQAKYLLTYTSQSIKEISYQVGYCNQFYFSREFSRMNGFSPRDFRKKYQSQS